MKIGRMIVMALAMAAIGALAKWSEQERTPRKPMPDPENLRAVAEQFRKLAEQKIAEEKAERSVELVANVQEYPVRPGGKSPTWDWDEFVARSIGNRLLAKLSGRPVDNPKPSPPPGGTLVDLSVFLINHGPAMSMNPDELQATHAITFAVRGESIRTYRGFSNIGGNWSYDTSRREELQTGDRLEVARIRSLFQRLTDPKAMGDEEAVYLTKPGEYHIRVTVQLPGGERLTSNEVAIRLVE